MAREADQRPNELEPEANPRALGIEARLGDALLLDQPAFPPMQRACDGADSAVLESERLADVSNRAARPIADHGRGERRAFARILAVDILNDLLTALVLEIHVDVGRLVALLGDEALDERLHSRGVHLGDPEAEADDRIRGRAPTLAQDAQPARLTNHVVDREKIGFVAKVGDQRELVLDAGAHFGRRTARPTPPFS